MKKKNLIILGAAIIMLSGCGKGKNVDFSKTNTVTFHDLTLEMPEVFTVDNEDSTDTVQYYSYEDSEMNNMCMLSLNIISNTNYDAKKAVKNILIDDTNASYNEKEINGYTWTIGYKEETAKSSLTVYAINKDNNEYAISYIDMGSGDDCAKALKVIEKNLNFK